MSDAAPAAARPRRIDQVVVGRVITMNPDREVIEDGAVAIAGGDILAVGPRPAVLRAYEPARVLGGPRAIVMPGMIDTHTHCAQAFVRSLTAGELPMIPRIYVPAGDGDGAVLDHLAVGVHGDHASDDDLVDPARASGSGRGVRQRRRPRGPRRVHP